MIENCVRTLFSESPAKWRSRDRIFTKTALDSTDIASATHHRLISPTSAFGKEFWSKAGIKRLCDASRKQVEVTTLLAFLAVVPQNYRDIQAIASRRS